MTDPIEQIQSLSNSATDQFKNQTGVNATDVALQKKPEAVSVGDFLSAAVDRDWMSSALERSKALNGFPVDPHWTYPEANDPNWAGIATEDYEQFGNVHSQAEWDYMKANYHKRMENEKALSTWGYGGIAARFLVDLADPVSLVAGAATAPFMAASEATRLANAVRVGAGSAAINAAMTGALSIGNPEMGAKEILDNALVGMAIGVPLGGLFKPDELAQMQRSIQQLRNGVNAASTDEAVGAASRSIGAAQASIPTLQTHFDEFVDDTLAQSENVGKTAYTGVRWDYANTLRGSDDEFVRNTVGRLPADPLGSDKGLTATGATELKSRIQKIQSMKIIRDADENFNKWLDSTGATFAQKYNPFKRAELRDEYMQQVGKKLLGIEGVYAPEVEAHASTLDGAYKGYLKELIKNGVLDDGLAEYGMPHRFNYESLQDLHTKYGTDQLVDLVSEGMRKSWLGRVLLSNQDEARGEANLRKVAEGYLQRAWDVGHGVDVEMLHGVSMHDAEYIRGLMKDVAADDDQINFVMDMIKRSMSTTSKDDAGKPSIAKHRMELDLKTTLALTPTGHETPELVNLGDLFEHNAELVFHSYNSSAAGRIAAAQAAGIKKDSDFIKIINAIKSRGTVGDKKTERVVAAATDVYNHLVGRPIEANPNGAFARVARNLSNYNMTRLGSTFGIAQIGDLGNVAAMGGIRGLIAGIPEFGSILKGIRTGVYSKPIIKELVEIAGLGLDHMSTNLYTSEYSDLIGTRAGRLEFALRAGSRGVAVASGMTKINEWSQVLVGKLIVNRFASGKATYSERRLASMGLSLSDAQRIADEITAHGVKSGKNVQQMNLHEWSDQSLAARFITAVRREATRAVQENDFGSTMPWQHSSLGKLITQFRSFMFTGWTKQTLHGLHSMDSETFATMGWGLLFGGLSYATYVVTSFPRDQWDEKLSPKNLAQAAFARTGWSSVIPAVVDTPLQMTGFDPFFEQTRGSGLPSGTIKSIASVELGDRAWTLMRHVGLAAQGKHAMSQQDLNSFRRVLPFANVLGVAHLWDAAGKGLNLPEK